jgi:prohibitin 2
VYPTEEVPPRQMRWLAGAAIALLAALGMVRTCLYVTPPGHATVVFNTFSGLQKGRVELPGVMFRIPGIETPITYTVLTRVWEFTNDPNSPNAISNAIAVNTADGQAFTVDVGYCPPAQHRHPGRAACHHRRELSFNSGGAVGALQNPRYLRLFRV